MNYNFVILRTDKGGRYARKIMRSTQWLNQNRYPEHDFTTLDFTISEFLATGVRGFKRTYGVNNTIIHARCANPRTKWTENLRELEESGYVVTNSVDCIELTSNKLACSLHLQDKVNHPKSWEWDRGGSLGEFARLADSIINSEINTDYIIAKPETSLSQGAHVQKIRWDSQSLTKLREEVEMAPGKKIVIQEYIPYTALHRVIVIGGRALPYTFVDRPQWHPNDWKVSCCLNRTTMQFNGNPPEELLRLAEQTQREVGGEINFIDIFQYTETSPGGVMFRVGYTNAEINTACSLNIHEELAKNAGHAQWNIHYRIAKYLVEKRLGV